MSSKKSKSLRGVRALLLSATAGLVLATSGLVGAGCGGPRYVRDSEEPRIDDYAMSTKLDRADLERLFDECLDSLQQSAVFDSWRRSQEPPTVAIFPIANDTSEHITGQLQTLLSKLETTIVNSGAAMVVSREQQDLLIKEIEKQQGGAYDPAHAAMYGRQLGARYFLTGKAYDNVERTEGERRTQYFLFMQVIDVETGAIRWQHEAAVTKALVK